MTDREPHLTDEDRCQLLKDALMDARAVLRTLYAAATVLNCSTGSYSDEINRALAECDRVLEDS